MVNRSTVLTDENDKGGKQGEYLLELWVFTAPGLTLDELCGRGSGSESSEEDDEVEMDDSESKPEEQIENIPH